MAHVLFNIALESCVVNFSCRLGEPVKKRLTSKRCPLGRTLDESSTTQPDQEMELLLFQQLLILFFLNCWLCETYFVPVINFELQSFRLSFPPSIFLVGGKADFNSQWVKTNIEWTEPQLTHSSAVWLVLKLCSLQCCFKQHIVGVQQQQRCIEPTRMKRGLKLSNAVLQDHVYLSGWTILWT